MAETTPTTPAAPAANDPLVNVDGRTEPLSRIVAGFKALSAKEQEAMAASTKAQKLEQQLGALAPDATAYRNLQAMLAKDPEAAKDQFERIYRMAKGELAGGQQNADAGTDAKMSLRMQALEQQIVNMQATEMGRQQVNEIRAAMDEYPLLKNSPEARRLAETFAATVRARDPSITIKDAVSSVHTDMVKLTNAGAANTVNAREALQAAGGAAPAAAAATPGLSEPPKLDRASLKNGTGRAWLEASLKAALAGPRGTTT